MKKLTLQNQSSVFEKIVRDRSGRMFCVRFVVFERDGLFRGKVVSCIPIADSARLKGIQGQGRDSFRFMPYAARTAKTPQTRTRFSAVISPFSSLDFFISQMTRAPSK